VHRSAIVNPERVREVASLGHGDHELVLDDGSRVRVGREYRERVLARLSS
jgi:DNA-binding LytR/AlgR family response regulator